MDTESKHPLCAWREARCLRPEEAAQQLSLRPETVCAVETGKPTCVGLIIEHLLRSGTELELHPLTIWRDAHQVGLHELAERLAITAVALRRYEIRERIPSWHVMDRIVIITGGFVTANSWLGKEAADAVARRTCRA